MTRDILQEGTRSDDFQVVAAIAAGDKEALAKLYDRYASVLTGLGMKIVKDQANVEELLHDVFVDVWQNAVSYDPDCGSVKTWLCLRMRSHGLEHSRSKELDFDDFLTEPGMGPSVVLALAAPAPEESSAAGLLGLESLSAAERRVISMMYFRGLSCQQIANKLRVPIETVKSRLAAARKGLERAQSDATGASA